MSFGLVERSQIGSNVSKAFFELQVNELFHSGPCLRLRMNILAIILVVAVCLTLTQRRESFVSWLRHVQVVLGSKPIVISSFCLYEPAIIIL